MTSPATRNLARTVELCATFVTGLGVAGLLLPQAHVRLWHDAPFGLGAKVAPHLGNPARRRREAAGQLAGGIATFVLLHLALAVIDSRNTPSPRT
jgi:hypothetical protein